MDNIAGLLSSVAICISVLAWVNARQGRKEAGGDRLFPLRVQLSGLIKNVEHAWSDAIQ